MLDYAARPGLIDDFQSSGSEHLPNHVPPADGQRLAEDIVDFCSVVAAAGAIHLGAAAELGHAHDQRLVQPAARR